MRGWGVSRVMGCAIMANSHGVVKTQRQTRDAANAYLRDVCIP
jgi:hypothetical protein